MIAEKSGDPVSGINKPRLIFVVVVFTSCVVAHNIKKTRVTTQHRSCCESFIVGVDCVIVQQRKLSMVR